MKTIRFFLPAFAMVLFLSTATSFKAVAHKGLAPSFNRQSTSFSFFRTHRQGKGITATWAVATADDVVGFSVQRTYEDATDPYAYWEEAGNIAFSATRCFTFTDKAVFPGIISYRIVALLADGSTVTSEISQVRIVSHK